MYMKHIYADLLKALQKSAPAIAKRTAMMMQQSKLEKVSTMTKIEHDMFADMMISVMMREKVKNDSYAQNLYAAMCNMEWQKTEIFPILKDELWSVSWRSAGGLVAQLQDKGDYLNWYCSGMGGMAVYRSPEEEEDYMTTKKYVPEGIVTDEIKADLGSLGWHPVPYYDDKD